MWPSQSRAIVQTAKVEACIAHSPRRGTGSACELLEQTCGHEAAISRSFATQGHRQPADGVAAPLRHAQQIAQDVDLVPQVVVQNLGGHLELALRWVQTHKIPIV